MQWSQLYYNSKKLRGNRMYYYQNPFFCQFQGQVFMIPQMMAPQVIYPESFQKNQSDYLNLHEQKKTSNFDNEVDSMENKNLTTLSKSPDSKQLREAVDSDYEPEKNEILTFYKKKNTESNLSNQIYSFISSGKSMKLMLKLFDGKEHKVEEFYKLIKKIKKTNKKYMNRSYISEMIKLEEGSTNFKIYKRSKCSLDIEHIRKALRVSFKYFLQNVCDLGLLTSKKMNKDTLKEHFMRKRQIMDFLTAQLFQNGETQK